MIFILYFAHFVSLHLELCHSLTLIKAVIQRCFEASKTDSSTVNVISRIVVVVVTSGGQIQL